MVERFIVNGKEMDLPLTKAVQLVYQSPLFTELDSIVSNRTNSVDFPLTPNNIKAVDYAHIVQSGSSYMYEKYNAVYYRGGVQLFKGYGYVVSISPTAIKMTFVWGNVEAFSTLMNLRLQDLQTDNINDFVDWTAYEVRQGTRFYNGLHCGREGYALPYLRVNEIVDRIALVSGVNLLRGNYFNDLVIPLTTRYNWSTTNEGNALHITHGQSVEVRGEMNGRNEKLFLVAPTNQDQDYSHQYVGDGLYDVSEVDKVRMVVKAGFTITKTLNTLRTPTLGVFTCDASLKNEKALFYPEFDKIWNVVRTSWGAYEMTLKEDIDITINVAKYSYIYILLSYGASATFLGIDLRLINSGDSEDGEVGFGGLLPLWRNLPDWSCGQFIKNIMKIKGLFAFAEDSNTINFVNASALYDNRSEAYDWSEVVQMKDNIPATLYPTFGSYAQRNICKYDDDDSVTSDYNGALIVYNDTLDKESDCISVEFSACQDDGIPYWVYDAEDESYEFNSDLNPRVMRLTGEQNPEGQDIITFAGLEWNNLIRTYYARLQDLLYRPKSIKLTALVHSLILKDLDMRKPIFIRQLASYFAFIKVTTKDERTADVELLKL